MRCSKSIVLAILAALPAIAGAQSRELAALPSIPESEQIRLAESAAPHEVSSRATIMVNDATGLREVRKGTNGYVCFIEWFQRATTMWPVCYEPELARVQVPLNVALEQMRARKATEDAYTKARDSVLAAVPAPRPGGLSYRLSPDMWTSGPNGKTGGPWMILVTAPNAKIEQLGFEAGRPTTPRSYGPRFGVAGVRAAGYYWIDVAPVRDSLPAGGTAKQ